MNFPDPHLPSILIVDDSQDDAFLLRYRLRFADVPNPVTTFEDVDAALQHIDSLNVLGRPAGLVFADIKMPGGFDLVRQIRDHTRLRDTRVAAVTYSNAAADIKRALELAVDGYLIKFPEPQYLADFVRHGPWYDLSRRLKSEPHALVA